MTSDVSGGLDMFDISGASTFVRAGGTQVTNHHFNALRSNTRFFVKNTILAALSLQDLAAIGEFLEPVVLRERMLLQEPKRHLDHVYFVESGLVSLRIVAAGSILETATIGSRGRSELPCYSGDTFRLIKRLYCFREARTGSTSRICIA